MSLELLCYSIKSIWSDWGSQQSSVSYILLFRADTICPALLQSHALAYLPFCYDEVSSVSYDQFYKNLRRQNSIIELKYKKTKNWILFMFRNPAIVLSTRKKKTKFSRCKYVDNRIVSKDINNIPKRDKKHFIDVRIGHIIIVLI
jgi:hypothetical protein